MDPHRTTATPDDSGVTPDDPTVQGRRSPLLVDPDAAAAEPAQAAPQGGPVGDARGESPGGSEPGSASTRSGRDADLGRAGEPLEEAKTVISRPASGSGSHPSHGHGATPAEVAGVLLGQELNHFRLEQLIGGGGMGAVFRAQDTRLDRTVAIKVIPRVGDDPDLLRRFRNEAQSAARLDHPNIARVYDVGRFDQWHYIVFEYIEGINLRDLVSRDGVLSIDDAVFYCRQVGEALEHAHQRGVVHRDIKPSNVLIRPDGLVKLVDMGLARSQQLEVSGDMTASGVTLGTFDYISPEQARDPRDADVRSDIYSLGCTLYFTLTGRPPYPGGTVLQKLLSHGNAPPPDPRGLRPEVSDNLTAVLHKMLAKRPADRYRRPVDLIADLHELAVRENLIRAQTPGTLTVTSGSTWPSLLERHLPWMAAAAVLMISVGWLRLLSSVDGDLEIRPPEPLAATASLSPAESVIEPAVTSGAPLAGSAPVEPFTAPAAAPAGSGPGTLAPTGVSPEDPPAYGQLLDLTFDFGGADQQADLVAPLGTQPSAAAGSDAVDTAANVRLIRVGGDASAVPEDTEVVDDLAAAIARAAETGARRIEIATPLTVTGPLKIPHDELIIAAAEGYSEIRFQQPEVLDMQRPVMIDVGQNRVTFERLHFSWRVPSSAAEGGSMFGLSNNRRVTLRDCSITIEDSRLRDGVYGFEVRSDLPSTPVTAADSSSGPPLVAIELKNVVARGEMTLLAMDVAAELQLHWENGLLAVSGRLLDSGGAVVQPPAGFTPLKLIMRDVTASVPMGLVRLTLGPSGRFPVEIDRSCHDCVFVSGADAPHIEIANLQDLQIVDQVVTLRGEGNDYDSSRGPVEMIRAIDEQGERLTYLLSQLSSPDRPTAVQLWMQERSPQAVVRWAQPTPPEKRPSAMTADDFQQDGIMPPGLVGAMLPQLPPAGEETADGI